MVRWRLEEETGSRLGPGVSAMAGGWVLLGSRRSH